MGLKCKYHQTTLTIGYNDNIEDFSTTEEYFIKILEPSSTEGSSRERRRKRRAKLRRHEDMKIIKNTEAILLPQQPPKGRLNRRYIQQILNYELFNLYLHIRI